MSAAGSPSSLARPRAGRAAELRVWLLTGPIGRLTAFVIDLSAFWWGWAVRDRIAARRGRR